MGAQNQRAQIAINHYFLLDGFDSRTSSGYTCGMKTAVSIPDDVFEKAEHLARRMKKSRSRLFSNAVVCVPLTSNLKWAKAPGNVLVPLSMTGLPKDSVANVSQLVTLDKALLTDRTGKLPRAQLRLILSGIDVVLDR